MKKADSPTSRRTCVTFMCDPEQISELRRVSGRYHMSMSQYVRFVLYRHLQAVLNKNA